MYRAFRDVNPDYFDYEDGSSSDAKQTQGPDGEIYVPVVPALSDAFCSLQLIDTYRFNGSKSTLREIFQIQSPQLIVANKSAKSHKSSKLQAENYSHSPRKIY